MLKSCPYCGIVPIDHKCPYKQRKYYHSKDRRDFRNTTEWIYKSREIRKRDRYLCKACEAELKGTVNKYTYNGLEVHHIIPLAEDMTKALDNDNLITLCSFHHKLAENGDISRSTLRKLISPPS